MVVATPGGRTLLGPVDLHVAAGERVAVLGVSGAGKSLLAAALTDTLPADLVRSGSVRTGTSRVALVQQDTAAALNPLVRVGAQVGRPLRRTVRDRATRARRTEALLARAGLEDPSTVARRYPGELSGGQRQRACLALALACGSPVIVADEATSALDVVTEAAVLTVLAELPATLALVTHDLAAARRTCDRAVVVDAGRVVEDAPLATLLAAPRHPAARELVRHHRLLEDAW